MALTRARAWLIVAGAGAAKSEAAWYRLVTQGMQAVGAEPIAGGALRYQIGTWPEPAAKQSLALPDSVYLPCLLYTSRCV